MVDTRDPNGVMPSDHRPLLAVFSVNQRATRTRRLKGGCDFASALSEHPCCVSPSTYIVSSEHYGVVPTTLQRQIQHPIASVQSRFAHLAHSVVIAIPRSRSNRGAKPRSVRALSIRTRAVDGEHRDLRRMERLRCGRRWCGRRCARSAAAARPLPASQRRRPARDSCNRRLTTDSRRRLSRVNTRSVSATNPFGSVASYCARASSGVTEISSPSANAAR